MFFHRIFLFSILFSVIRPQKKVSNNLYACMLFCSDGKRIISPRCYKTDLDCQFSLSNEARECSDLKHLQIFALAFPAINSKSCSNFLTTLLHSGQNDPALQTKEEIGKASCGCNDMVSKFLLSITLSAFEHIDFCSAAVSFFMKKFRIVQFLCSKKSLVGLLGNFCSVLIDNTIGEFFKDSLKGLCGFIVEAVEKVTGLSLKSVYREIQDDAGLFLNKTSNRICGMLLCSSTSTDGCQQEKYSKGITAMIASTAVAIYCSSGELIYVFSIFWIVLMVLLS